MNIAVMIATANDGLNGLARLLGLDFSTLPQEWKECSLGLVHKKQSTSGRSSIIEFAAIQGVVRKEYKELFSDIYVPRPFQPTKEPSIRSMHNPDVDNSELTSLQAFYQRHDSLGYYAGLYRVHNKLDDSLVFWTQDEDPTSLQDRREFSAGLVRMDELKAQIADKKKLEDELLHLNKRLGDIRKSTEAKLLRRRQKKVRVVSPSITSIAKQSSSISDTDPLVQSEFLIQPQAQAQTGSSHTPTTSSGSQMKPSSSQFTTTPITSNPSRGYTNANINANTHSRTEEDGSSTNPNSNDAEISQQNFVV
jgi:hypothetical protein